MIEFRDVSVRYGAEVTPALDAVSFAAMRGHITAVVGPNGSGKSTLVRTLLGRADLAGGTIHIDGEPMGTSRRRQLATRIAAITQREETAFPLTVRDYVALGRYPHMGWWSAETAADRDAIVRAHGLTGTEAFADRTLHELSGGEWQRVRLARALAQGGDALVLDEPTTFLDVGHEMAIFELLGRLAHEGQAVLLVSHQLNLVARFASHMVLLHRGRIAAAGAPDAVMQGAILEAVYEWPLVITRDPAIGSPTLVPLRVPVRREYTRP